MFSVASFYQSLFDTERIKFNFNLRIACAESIPVVKEIRKMMPGTSF